MPHATPHALSWLCALCALALPVAGQAQSALINEFHYDNVGTDAGEFVEVAVPAGVDVATLVLTLYNGNGGASYGTFTGDTFTAGGTSNGVTFYTVATPGFQNGAPDGLALSTASGTLLEFLSYEGTFAAADGPAMGTTSTDVGVSEDPAPAEGMSLQRTGSGTKAADFTWTGPAMQSPGAVNAGQTFGAPAQPMTFYTLLVGANEVPPVQTEASGGVTVTVDGTTVTVTGRFARLQGDYRASHLHRGAAGTNGPVVQALDPTLDANQRGGVFEASKNKYTVRQTFADSLKTGLAYVNIHSATFPSGEIRGQVTADPHTLTFALSGAREVPPVQTAATGSGTVTLTGTRLELTGSFSGLQGDYRASHVHGGAVGTNGPVVQALSAVVNADQRGGSFVAAQNTYTLRPAFADSVRAGLAYVNVHSAAFPSGEVRGQILAAPLNATASEEGVDAAAFALTVANPVRSAATVRFTLAAASVARLALYDVLGREVAVLSEGPRAAGDQAVPLRADGLAPGLYVLRLQAGASTASRTLTVVR